ncbi:MAG: CoB--CoM heterodisulfide reductase iron-sulfur subunit B family protein [Desulfobacterales bacterium]|uniref:CoB--CoM heterodisulfide reductase iron-sulfur subunit B family protein n=1 Tax=Candidatus Desulfatibia profunda TaxID=2841695 RepID=A0A8J6TJ52_9BACT|nr:CoB--CoM heterodisulfide reductase iron-sulfur subunit B family protein [Candidatus Desulfatibia profunda]MBL7180236.1 CoB--CoM heterodisulfide reductase iron-sulfur subunit B family protein [Desulfobacterales bacterium]
MKLAFYPGCSLEGMANDYSRSITAVFRDLDIGLVEIKDWSCCGATAAHSLNELMAVTLPARNLAEAEKMGLDIVSPCPNCFNRLRFSQIMIQKKIIDVPWEVTAKSTVYEMTRFLAGPEMLAQIAARVRKPLKGLKVVCYYGCQMVRPPRITGFTDYENPQTIDRIVAAVGAEALDWSYKTTCCGASIGIGRRDIQESLTMRLLDKARQTGAEAVVVSCPLCQANLDMLQRNKTGTNIPVFYLTELMRIAFEPGRASGRWFRMHIADPVPLLIKKELLP